MNKFNTNLLLGPPEQLSVKYFSLFLVFLKLFPKVSDTAEMVSRMKWVKGLIVNTRSSDKTGFTVYMHLCNYIHVYDFFMLHVCKMFTTDLS